MTQRPTELHGLLPFYVNGTLSVDERIAVEAGLEQDPELRAALEETRSIYSDMHAEPMPYPGDTSLARLMKAIETVPQDSIPAAAQPKTAKTPASTVLKLALVAALVALVVQGFIFWRGDLGVGLASGSAEGTVTVAFQPDATEGEIRALLMELDLQIVSGPSSLGLYQLRGDGTSAVLQALPNRTDVVESAENAMD